MRFNIQSVAATALLSVAMATTAGASSGEVELTGTIQSLGASSLVVAGDTFSVSSQTIVLDHQNNAISFSDLQLGQVVEVKAQESSMLAERLRIEDANGGVDDDVVFEAETESVGDDSLHAMGKTVWVDNKTILENRRHESIQLSDIRPGVDVRVDGTLQNDGSILARTITANVTSGGHSQILTGTLTSKGRRFINVGSRKIMVNGKTRIENSIGEHISFAALHVGQSLRVEYQKVGAAFVAKEIKVL